MLCEEKKYSKENGRKSKRQGIEKKIHQKTANRKKADRCIDIRQNTLQGKNDILGIKMIIT